MRPLPTQVQVHHSALRRSARRAAAATAEAGEKAGNESINKRLNSSSSSSSSSDSAGLFQWVGRSAKPAVACIAGACVLGSAEWDPLYYVSGAVLNALLSKTLKSIFRAPRPARSPKQGNGLPSSHAQTLFFFLTVLLLALYSGDAGGGCARHLLSAGLVAYACGASLWRVAVHLHTLLQTAAGAGVGAVVGYWVHARRAAGVRILQTAASRIGVGLRPGARSAALEALVPMPVAVPVPLFLRVAIICIGACVLYHKTLRRVLTRVEGERTL